ncbi:MAG TPA: lamin tail domain-containing protein, partial [Turneriella sp.]|nr:lamin tail domain-containing protein [Turneriella sp.]
IIARSRAGVQVKVAFDADVRDSDTGSLALQASGAFVVVATPGETTQGQLLYGNNGTGVMRHNYCLSDERYVWLSTAAPDDAQMRLTPNIAIKVGSPQFGLARDFLRESSMFSQLLFGGGKAKTDYTTKFAALDQVIAAYWGPQESPMDVLGTELSEATRTVDFYSTAFQATNTSSTKSYLDVPTVLKALETAKGVTIRKYFSSQALFDSASKAYTLTNPSQYVNSNVRVGANIFVVDRNLSSARTYIYTGALRSQGNSSDDSVLLELRGPRVAQLVAAYLDRIGGVAVPVSNSGDTAAAGQVVISEIIWMGSYSNTQTGDGADEFIELYNNTASAINISGWQFACTTDGTNNNSAITLPPGALIAPGGYFVVASKNTGAFAGSANHFDSKVGITNSSRECRLGNGKTAATVYGIANFGDVIDTIGNNTNGFDTAGWNRGVNDGSPNFIRKSMERVNPSASGTANTNWRNNGYTFGLNTLVASNFRSNTFASPGASGTFTETAAAGNVVINEILWMGSYDNGGTGQTDDEFIELYNNTASSIDISNWTISGTGISTITIPTGQTIAANGYYVIARNTSLAVSSANYSTTTAMSITNGGFQLELRTSLNTLIDTANNGGAPLAGVNDATNLYRRSMERTTTGTDGTLAASWQSAFTAGSGIAAGYSSRTLATPGQLNSTIPADPAVGDVVVNELMWMGSYDNAGTTQTDDEFIELWNKTASAINISFWQVNGTGINAVTLPPGQTLPANGYYVIARNNLNAFTTANYYKSSTLGLSSTTLQVELRTSRNTVIDTANNGGAPHAGLNDTTNQIRRSMERRPTATDGTLAASWLNSGVVGTNVAAGFSTRTIATPGQANSFYPQTVTVVSSTSITVQYNLLPTAGTGAAGAENTANYTFTGGLTVSAASLAGNVVTLTTSAQTSGASYTLTISNVTASGNSATLSPNTANVTGFVTMANLVINEVAPAETSSLDLIELYAVSGGSINGLEIFEGGTSLKVLPNITVATGDYIVIHINASGTDETSSKSQSGDVGHIATAWDYWSADTGLTATDNAIILKSSSAVILDACVYGNNTGTWTGPTISTVIDPIIAASQWTKAGGTFAESDAVNNAGTILGGSSFRRTPNGNDTNNSAADWTSAAGLTIGSGNP